MTRGALACIRMTARRQLKRLWCREIVTAILRENPTLSTRAALQRAHALTPTLS